MSAKELGEIAALIRREKDQLLTRWREQVKLLPSAAHLDRPTLNDHIPTLIEEMSAAFEQISDDTIAQRLRSGSPASHGIQREDDGFDIVEVVAEYNILRACVHDLVLANGLSLSGRPFHVLNLVLDGAIGLAVKAFAEQKAAEAQQRRSEYLTFVAHDLRTPLNAISLATKLLELSMPDAREGGDAAEMIATLQRNVAQLEALVGGIVDEHLKLDPALGVDPERRYFDLWPLVESVLEDLRTTAEEQGTRLINSVRHDLVVFADASLLRRVFQNLVNNAINYTPGGHIEVAAEHDEAAGQVACRVSDNGRGIAPEQLEKVFEKGTGDPEREDSTGLGLAIVKSFVDAHGGDVHAESAPGRGTTIRFVLPVAQAAVPR